MFKRIIHYALTILVLLLIAFIIFIVVAEIILHTDIPGRRVLASLSQRTGMNFEAQQFRTTLTGKTHLSNLRIKWPMEGQAFVSTEDVILEHNCVHSLLMGRSFQLKKIKIKNASVHIMEDSRGRWNIQSLLELRKGRGLFNNDGNLNPPAISAENVKILVKNQQQQELIIDPVSMTARHQGLMWEFVIRAEPVLVVKGSIAQASPFNQIVDVEIKNPGKLNSTLIAKILNDLRLRFKWNGVVQNSGLDGLITCENLQVQDMKITGNINIQANANYICTQADQLTIENKLVNLHDVKIAGGQLEYFHKDKLLVLNGMNLLAGNSQVDLNAKLDMRSGKAGFSGRWIEITQAIKTKVDCQWSGQAQLSSGGIKNAEMNMEGYWQSSDRELQLKAIAKGTGTKWKKSLWSFEFPVLSWKDRWTDINLGPGQIDVALDWPAIRLGKVEFANFRRINAEGYYFADTQNWRFAMDADGIRIRSKADSPRASFNIDITGDSNKINIEKTKCDYGDFQADAAGRINLLTGDLKTSKLQLSGSLPEYKQSMVLGFSKSKWKLNAAAKGTIEPLNVGLEGDLIVDANQPAQSQKEELNIPFRLHADGSELRLETASYKNQYGSWLFSGYYHTANEKGRLLIDFNDIQLSIISGHMGKAAFEGQASGTVAADFKELDFSEAEVEGKWQINNFKSGAFAFETGSGEIKMAEGVARLSDIYLKQGQGGISGNGTIDFNTVKQASFKIKSDNWLYPVADMPVIASIGSDLDFNIDVSSGRMTADGQCKAEIDLLKQHLGTINFAIKLNDRILFLEAIDGSVLNGDVGGNLQIPFNNIFDSRADVAFSNISLEQFKRWQQRIEGLSGKLSGRINIEKANDKNPLESTKVELGMKIEDGLFRGAQIGSMRLIAFAGPNRLLVTESALEVFGGLIQAQARWTMHDRSLIHLRTKIDDIDLAQIIHVINRDTKPVQGIIDGDATLLTTADLQLLSGKVLLRLSKSDLINSTIISSIYQSLAPGQRPSSPQGYGTIELYPQGYQVEISSFYYFNEGVEIRGSGRIADIRKGADSMVSGLVFGTTSPLGGVKLPGIRELDDLMGVLQVGSAVIKVKGTLNNIQTEVVPFPQVSGAIRSLIWKQLHEDGQ